MRAGSFVVVLVACCAAVAAQGPPPPPNLGPNARGGSSGTMPVSAATKVTYLIGFEGSKETLELLVLWRGSPGWFAKGGRSGSSSRGGLDEWSMEDHDGGVSLTLRMNTQTRTVWVQDSSVALGAANAILVDRVDSPQGPQIVRTLTVDAALGDEIGPARILPILAQSKDLVDHLQCDSKLSDERLHERLAPLCARIQELVNKSAR
jgi:hypothetical protein